MKESDLSGEEDPNNDFLYSLVNFDLLCSSTRVNLYYPNPSKDPSKLTVRVVYDSQWWEISGATLETDSIGGRNVLKVSQPLSGGEAGQPVNVAVGVTTSKKNISLIPLTI